jgi:alkaline phosphatase D
LRQPAEVRILTSSIQVVPEDHGWEKWMNMPRERQRLFDLIRDTRATGVLAISGDRHLAELSVMDAGIGYPLYDLTSSGLNQAEPRWRAQEVNRHRVATMNYGNNFGLILIDWNQEDPLIRLQIRDEEGDVILQQKILLSWLQPGFLKDRMVVSAVPKLASGAPLTGEEIAKRLDQEVRIEMTVQATGQSSSGLTFLNSAVDRREKENFTVVLSKTVVDQFRQKGVADVRKHFQDQLIRVRGKLSKFRDQPQIVLDDAVQIEIITP